MYPQPSNRSREGDSPSILIVGMGALGCPAAAVLVDAGVPRLTLVDHDHVELSNLQRQTLFTRRDVGRPKVRAAAAALSGRTTRIETVVDRLDPNNAEELIGRHDFTIDACDDPETKFLINEVAVRVRRPYCYGGVVRSGGLVLTITPGTTACLACAFPPAPEGDTLQQGSAPIEGCHDAGILAPVAGVIGCLQAREALATIAADERGPHAGRMMIYELRGRRWKLLDLPRDRHCRICGTPPAQAVSRRIESCHS